MSKYIRKKHENSKVLKQYLISPYEELLHEWQESFVLVLAHSEQEAIEKFYEYYHMKDYTFIEHLYDKSCDSFAWQFWVQTDEEKEIIESGGPTIEDSLFKERVVHYFKEHPDFGTMYINYYFDDFNSMENFKFPDEMIRYLWLREMKEFQWGVVKILDLSKIVKLT